MKYLLLLILIGIAIYYAMKWQKPKNQSSGNPYSNPDSTNQNTAQSDSGPYQQTGGTTKRKSGGGYGKWIGGGLGWAFGGPIGGLLGFVFGSMFDGSSITRPTGGGPGSGDFVASLLVLTAAVMKVDGKVTRSELEFVKRFLVNNFGVQRATEYVGMLGEIVKKEFNVSEMSLQIKQYMDYSSRLMLLQYLFGVAMSDGKAGKEEIGLINTIASYLGISRPDYESIMAMFIKDTESAYKILEIEPSATNEEVKKAYRELAKKYHPDKVAHLGEEVKKAAEEKIMQLNAAYDSIKAKRGMV
ncbi:MAG: TerB family tellurite resistance protein [Bacteroidales bacterium]|jgi:DnaJ like chaperone protein